MIRFLILYFKKNFYKKRGIIIKKFFKLNILIGLIFASISLNRNIFAGRDDYWYTVNLLNFRHVSKAIFDNLDDIRKHFFNVLENDTGSQYVKFGRFNYDEIDDPNSMFRVNSDILSKLRKSYKLEVLEKNQVPQILADIEYAKLFRDKKNFLTETATAYFKSCFIKLLPNLLITEMYVQDICGVRTINFYLYDNECYVTDYGMAKYLYEWKSKGDTDITENYGNPEQYFHIPLGSYLRLVPKFNRIYIPRWWNVWGSEKINLQELIPGTAIFFK